MAAGRPRAVIQSRFFPPDQTVAPFSVRLPFSPACRERPWVSGLPSRFRSRPRQSLRLSSPLLTLDGALAREKTRIASSLDRFFVSRLSHEIARYLNAFQRQRPADQRLTIFSLWNSRLDSI